MFNKLKSLVVVLMLVFVGACAEDGNSGGNVNPVPVPNPGLPETEVIPVNNVYEISTMEELVWIANQSVTDNFDEKTVKFMADIDMDNKIFSGIIKFAGKLEGNNKTISNLIIGDGTTNYVGLINTLENGGHIENLTIANGRISGNTAVGSLVGYVVGRGTIVGVTNKAEVRGKTDISSDEMSIGGIGGLVGLVGFIAVESTLTVTDSLNTGDVIGHSSVGGIIGSSSIQSVSNIKNSSNVGIVQGVLFVGGLVGKGFNTLTIDNSSNRGDIQAVGQAFRIGGLVGSYDGTSTLIIDNSFNSVIIDGFGDVGGIVGGADGKTTMTLTNVHSYATKIGSIVSGGLVGGVYDESTVTVTNAYWLYDVTVAGGGIHRSIHTGAFTGTAPISLDIAKFKDSTATAINFVDWDFTTIWEMGADYPTLKNLK